MKDLIQTIARTNSTVLITGSTGTGKSHLARKIHDMSRRAGKRFIAVNLATLSENLLESELFGHERGAFSGADTKRVGKLELANEGTVFLDEIGELNIRLQTKLLEVLNSKTICPVGSNREQKLDIRIVAATNRNLARMVGEGLFREDLYFRLNIFEIPLKDLKDENHRIIPLAEGFAQRAAVEQYQSYNGMEEDFKDVLLGYAWPGNVRELKNAVDFAVAVSGGECLRAEFLPAYARKNLGASQPVPVPALQGPAPAKPHFPIDYHEWKAQSEKAYLCEVLKCFEGKINRTARETRLSKVTLIDKIRKYGIDVEALKYERYKERSLA